MTTLFVDSNVVIYSLDRAHPENQERCATWLRTLAERGALVLSPQVCAETRGVLLRKLKLPSATADAAVGALLPWCTAPMTADEVAHALLIVNRWKTDWWDALILASAFAARCTHILTEDAFGAAVIEGMRIVDPFKTAPADILGAA